MSLLDRLTDQILSSNRELFTVRPVVEKEILHQDILREMSLGGFLRNLTFIGGTCLRNCYNSPRLSENLDFTGGRDFKKHFAAFEKEKVFICQSLFAGIMGRYLV